MKDWKDQIKLPTDKEYNTFMTNIGRLKEYRRQRGATQLAFAKIIGVTRTQYNRMEGEKSRIPIQYLEIIASFYGDSLEILFKNQ